MAVIDSTHVEIPDHTQNANGVKDAILTRLWYDGIITEEQFDFYSENWQVIIIRKSWFPKWMKKFSPGGADGYIYKFVQFEDKEQ